MERDSTIMHEQQQKLQQEADKLAHRLQVILRDKPQKRSSDFDSETPVEKTLNFLKDIVAVSLYLPLCMSQRH